MGQDTSGATSAADSVSALADSSDTVPDAAVALDSGVTDTAMAADSHGGSASAADTLAPPETVSRCPPSGPYGTDIGDVLPDVELSDCEGKRYSLHDLCERPAGYFFLYAGW